MRQIVKLLVGLALLLAASLAAVSFVFERLAAGRFQRPEFSIHDEVANANSDLGKRIFTVRNGCVECHGVDLAGAKVMENSAMGSIYGANITPYTLSSWSDEEIASAIRYGLYKDGRSLKFMPSFDFEKLSKSDVASLIAYIRSVPPVAQQSHENTFGPVAKALAVFGQMPVMFPAYAIDMNKSFADKPAEQPTEEFGRYLANACAGCHGNNLAGGKIKGGDPSWPPAANIRFGKDSFWTEDKFRGVISSGNSARTGQPLRTPMPVAALKQMNEVEIKALWNYLSSLH